jgi:RNA polymerase sigma factor (sigma-70 family)
MTRTSEMIDQPLRGDEAELFRLHYTRLVRQVQRGDGVPEAVAEDCASIAFLQLCRRQPERCEQTPGWLRVVARHEAYAWHRHTNRCWSLDEPVPAADGGRITFTDLVPAPVDVELAFDAREALRSLAALGDRRRTALTLKVAGYSYREIQELLGVTFTWVNRHITEGRGELRKLEQLLAIAREVKWSHIGVPHLRRQTRSFWAKRRGMTFGAALWGIDLGLIFTTYVAYSGAWVLLAVVVAAGDPQLGAAAFGSYWCGRALSVWIAPLLVEHRQGLLSFASEITRRRSLFRAVHVGGVCCVAAVVMSWLAMGERPLSKWRRRRRRNVCRGSR